MSRRLYRRRPCRAAAAGRARHASTGTHSAAALATQVDSGVSALAARSIRAATAAGTSKRLGVLLLDRREIWASFPPGLVGRARPRWAGSTAGTSAVQWSYATATRRAFGRTPRSWFARHPMSILTRGTPATQALQRATRRSPSHRRRGSRSAPRLREDLRSAWRQHHRLVVGNRRDRAEADRDASPTRCRSSPR